MPDQNNPTHDWLGITKGSLLLAVLYYLCARLGLLLAIPPGYATAFWPASGVAVAILLYRGENHCLGIFLGSLAANLHVSLDIQGSLNAVSWWIASGIALGSTLQGFVAAKLVRRFTSCDWQFIIFSDLLKLVLLGGPLGCLIAATVGNSVLLGLEMISPSAFWPGWFTWWVGDMLGVLVLTPLILILLQPNTTISASRKITIALPLLILFALMVVLYQNAQQKEYQRLKAQLVAETSNIVNYIEKHIELYEQALISLQTFYKASASVTREQFTSFAGPLRANLPGIRALEWLPLVTSQTERQQLEQQAQLDGFPGYQFTEKHNGTFVRAAERSSYYPVYYMEPLVAAKQIMGYDLYSEPTRSEAIGRAMLRDKTVSTPPVNLVTDVKERGVPSYLIFRRVAAGAHQGVVLGVISVVELFRPLQQSLAQTSILISLQDTMAHTLLYQWPAAALPSQQNSFDKIIKIHQHLDLTYSDTVHLADRLIRISTTLEPNEISQAMHDRLWPVLTAGFFIMGAMSLLIVSITGAQTAAKQLVDTRTQALQASELNNRLLLESVNKQLIKLAYVNQELEDFTHIASHDLKEPARTVNTYCEFLKEDLGDAVSPLVQKDLRFITTAAKRMDALINDLLAYSRAGREDVDSVPVDLAICLQDITADLDTLLHENSGDIALTELPKVMGDVSQLRRIFQNLIQNAVIFRRADVNPHIEVFAVPSLLSTHVTIAVKDNGLGIAPEHHAKIFGAFQRLHSMDVYPGTGMGLAIAKKLVKKHKGSIWLESEEGYGSTFYVSLPRVESPDTDSVPLG